MHHARELFQRSNGNVQKKIKLFTKLTESHSEQTVFNSQRTLALFNTNEI